MSDPAPTDAERYPTLTPEGAALLGRMREHPAAPRFRNESGNRLLAEEVAALRDFERDVLVARFEWDARTPPPWLEAFVAAAFRDVPHYRALGAPPRRFADLRSVGRADFAADIAAFVPDTVPLDRLINFRTTGTTGHPLLLASHPVVAARYLAFHKRALARSGLALAHGRGEVGVILLGHQRACFTYVSVTPTQDESGLAKINLHPDDWRDPADRAAYLDAMRAEVYSGDPISFAALLDIPTTHRPRALVSVGMALSPALRDRLVARFGCPLLDVYSMNEVGPIGVHDAALDGFALLQPGLYVEVLDDDDRALPPGERGEIAVTGGFNFCLPLLRYRTGDFGALDFSGDVPAIRGLSGRRPVRFRTAGGAWLNNIDVSHALRGLPLTRFGLHQDAAGGLRLRVPERELALAPDALAALRSLFGDQPVAVEPFLGDDKLWQYTTELAGATG